MAENSAIGWTDHTHNEWIGCDEVGPGCDFCYAREADRRYQWGVPAAERVAGVAPHWGVDAPRYLTSEANRRKPLAWNAAAQAAGRPAMVFAHSLSDVFDKRVPPDWRAGLFRTWRATPWLRWIVVTKRIGLANAMLPPAFPRGYENVGIVATVCNQQEVDRDVPRLRGLNVARHPTWVGLSVEPQLGPITLADHVDFLDWVIGGGESRQGKGEPRVYDLAWPRGLIEECRLARVAYFEKQVGARPVDAGVRLKLEDRAGASPVEWPPDLRVQQFPEALLR